MLFTPISTKRTIAAAAAIQPQIRREDRTSLDQRDKEKLPENAIKPLSTKFSIMGSLTSQGKTQLESTYSITTLLQDLEKRPRLYNMQHVFTVIKPDPGSSAGDITINTINLLKRYAVNDTTLEIIKISVEHYRSWGQLYDLKDLDWTGQLLKNSCNDELKNKVNEEMLDVDPIHQGGPTFFFIMMKILVQTSDQATRALL